MDLLYNRVNKFIHNESKEMARRREYYDGIQDIRNKKTADGKPNNKRCYNLCRIIADSFSSMFMGENVTYSTEDDLLADELKKITNYNDDDAVNYQHAHNCFIYGKSRELMWIDETKNIRYSVISPEKMGVVYGPDLDKSIIQAFMVYEVLKPNALSDEDVDIMVKVYDAENIYTYKYQPWTLIDVTPHYFGQVPVVEFTVAANKENSYDCIKDIQDNYNNIISLNADNFDYFADSYLVLSGVDADDEEISKLRENRTIVAPEGGDAHFLQKTEQVETTKFVIENDYKMAFTVSGCIDLNKEDIGNLSGAAMKMRCITMLNKLKAAQRQFEKAFSRRFDIITGYLNLIGHTFVNDITETFAFYIPSNLSEEARTANLLKGIVSKETMLKNISIVDDVTTEMDRLKEEEEDYERSVFKDE